MLWLIIRFYDVACFDCVVLLLVFVWLCALFYLCCVCYFVVLLLRCGVDYMCCLVIMCYSGVDCLFCIWFVYVFACAVVFGFCCLRGFGVLFDLLGLKLFVYVVRLGCLCFTLIWLLLFCYLVLIVVCLFGCFVASVFCVC